MTRVFVYITQIWGLNILLILVVRKFKFCFFNSKWDTLSVLNIKNEKYFVSKNRGAAPLTFYAINFVSVANFNWSVLLSVSLWPTLMFCAPIRVTVAYFNVLCSYLCHSGVLKVLCCYNLCHCDLLQCSVFLFVSLWSTLMFCAIFCVIVTYLNGPCNCQWPNLMFCSIICVTVMYFDVLCHYLSLSLTLMFCAAICVILIYFYILCCYLCHCDLL
jgi:hypothetical protein